LSLNTPNAKRLPSHPPTTGGPVSSLDSALPESTLSIPLGSLSAMVDVPGPLGSELASLVELAPVDVAELVLAAPSSDDPSVPHATRATIVQSRG